MRSIATITIGQLIADGHLTMSDGYRTKQTELRGFGYRIIRVADVRDGEISLASPDYVSVEYERAIGEKTGREGDVLLTTKGTVGRVALVPKLDQPIVYSPQLCFFRVSDQSVLSRNYLRYWLKSTEFLRQALDRMNNTDMAPYINLADIRSVQVRLPPIGDQHTTATFLSSLDDKIAANSAIATTAGHVSAALFGKAVLGVDSSESTFQDVAEVGGGGTPATSVQEYWEGGVPWATPTDVTALNGPYLHNTARLISSAGLDACSSSLYPAGSILMTSRATIGAFAIAANPMAVNQGFIVVNPRDQRLRWWIFHEMQSRVDEFITHANGATFPELSRGRFKKFTVRLADEAVMHRFNADATALHDAARAALVESRQLAALRDTLLPQLMSGKLRVKDAEKQVEEVV